MAEHLISTPALLDACHRCGHPLLTAHAEGTPVRADVEPLDLRAELAVLLDGRATYDVQPHGIPRKPYLFHRHQFRIKGRRNWAVVAEHKCPPGPHFPPPKRKPPTELVIPFGPPIPDQPPF